MIDIDQFINDKANGGDGVLQSILSDKDQWTDGTGKIHDMERMDINYLKNCINMLKNYHFFPGKKYIEAQKKVYFLRDQKVKELESHHNELKHLLDAPTLQNVPLTVKNKMTIINIQGE
ncbi:hypothetical protein [Maridesulfovibrio zosterae]|uniref:hypothetical protein n=1 Tax=Maridesulfovibrio zosterae TaxID=82171 RepID=UPI000429AED6|nr:hypothetical protein [Maridesulfovibrio zosterae]